MNDFFANPSWISLIGIVVFFGYQLIKQYISEKKFKVEKKNNQDKEKSEQDKKEASYKVLDRLSDAVELLIAKETNNVNLMTAENIIQAKLNESKAIIKNEINRIFKQNHRDNINRQKMIKQAIANVSRTVYENDIKKLKSVYYKNKSLNEFLINIDNDIFYDNLLKLLFTTGGNAEDERADIMYYISSSFDTFILNGKKFYNNL